MFKWINPKIASLEERLRNAEDLKNSLEVDNSWLQSQVVALQAENKMLLEKIFSITGIDRQIPPTGNASSTQIPIQSGRQSWAQQRQQLEAESRRKFWEAEKNRKEAEIANADIDKLEKAVGIGDQDASKIG